MLELIVAVVCTGAVDVDVHQRDGKTQSGAIVALSDDELMIQMDQGTSVLPTANVRELRARDPAQASSQEPTTRVTLRGGSVIAAAEYTTQDKTATIKLLSGHSLNLPTRSVKLVVLSRPDKVVAQQRQEILDRKVAGDIVIVRRKNQKLDYYEGVLGNVANQKLQFEYDKEWLPISLSRIDSFCYFQPNTAALEKPRCQLVTHDGSTWEVTHMALQDDRLQLTLADNLSIQLPAGSLRTVRFASTSTVYLSDLEPAKVTMTPSLQIAALAEDLSELDSSDPFLPNRDESLFGAHQHLTLAEADGTLQQYTKGLAIHSRTELTYRLAGEFRQFDAMAGLDPLVRKAGCVNLVILADDNELYRAEIRGGESPTRLKLDVSSAKWLTILVDYGDASDVADRLNLCDARLTK